MSPDHLHEYLLNGAGHYHFNGAKRKARKRDGHRCVICGTQKNLTTAHRIHRNGSTDLRLNDPLNLITLCDRDHKRFDMEEEPHLHILYWDPNDKKNGLEVAIETEDGGLVRIDRKKLAFYR